MITDGKTFRTAPIPTIRRLPLFLEKIKEHVSKGEAYISSATLAKELHLDPIVVRKDLAVTGVAGMPRRGFPAVDMISAIKTFLGWDNTTDAILCGVGSLGKALLGYEGFQRHGLKIIAAFDINPLLIGTKERGVNVFGPEKMKTLIRRMNIRIGIITVPKESAQGIANQLVDAGIRGIWNFTSTKLVVPKEIVVQCVDLAESLAVLSHHIALIEAKANAMN